MSNPFDLDPHKIRSEEDLPGRKTYTTGDSKPANERFTNLHDWLEFPNSELDTTYLTGGMSGVLMGSGDFADKMISNTLLGTTLYSLEQGSVPLLKGPAVAMPSGRLASIDYVGQSQAENAKNIFVEEDSIFKHSGVYPHIDPDNLPDSTTNSAFSNAAETRLEARKRGLYNAFVFNPYIHYDDKGPLRKIDHRDNYKAATKYLDPYSDLYIFQTTTSFDPPEDPIDPNDPTGNNEAGFDGFTGDINIPPNPIV